MEQSSSYVWMLVHYVLKAEAQISYLKEQLAEKVDCLRMVGEIGHQLIETNKNLESCSKEGSALVEKLEQEKYALQLKLDQKVSMEKNYYEELDGLKSALKHKNDRMSFQHDEHNSRVSDINKKVSDLRSELEARYLKEKQLNDQITQLTQMLQDAQKSQTEQIILQAQGEGGDKNYSEFQQDLLSSKDAEVGKVLEELDAKSMLLLAEREKLLQCERKLYNTEQQLTKSTGQGMKLNLRVEELNLQVEELRLKYEPDAMKTSGKIRKTSVEVMQLAPPSDSAAQDEDNSEAADVNSGEKENTELGMLCKN